ncbi:regulator of drug sensitivity 2 [[Candida] anglica]|uniref:Regulator of drug sensitivity 2 n=1 Tax=[Candida] anglica TaxID=148631 RepID=A0ABP0END2_9ASCO
MNTGLIQGNTTMENIILKDTSSVPETQGQGQIFDSSHNQDQVPDQGQVPGQVPGQGQAQGNEQGQGHNHGELEREDETSKKAPKRKKKKVEMACVYCRRSHMICDDTRPCQRCIKRGIGHLCYDEPSNNRQRQKAAARTKKPDLATSESFSPQPVSPSTGLNTPNNVSKGFADLNQQPIIHPTHGQDRTNQNQHSLQPKTISNSVLSQTLPYNQETFFYSEHAGSEFSSLNDFLSMIDDPELVNGNLHDTNNNNDPLLQFGMQASVAANNVTTNTNQNNSGGAIGDITNDNNASLTNLLAFSPNSGMFSNNLGDMNVIHSQPQQHQQQQPQQHQQQSHHPLSQSQFREQQSPSIQNRQMNQSNQNQTLTKSTYNYPKPSTLSSNSSSHQPVISDSARDKFFLTAADPTTEISPEERLKQVIKAKLEAGLLQPYNYAKGYARLQSYMDNYMNISSRQRILKPLSIFRPAFRAIARTLKDVDLVLVEESFERMLLDYDRVFTSMAIPACLWRRTGEIYRGNKEFASLVGVSADDLKDGKLAIYELMSEESAVNFWEKYGAIAFDKGQKAVLTSCNLRTKDGIKRKSCCFSFTIRRDRYNIPSCIVGNFIPIDPST